jgi:hypothetical protein
MGNQELLLQMSEGADVPIQVSAADGATRGTEAAETAQAPGSCTSWCGWGN